MRKQWRCFHCDEVFTSSKWAAVHFGADCGATAACKLAGHQEHLVVYIRRLEEDVARYRMEDSDVMRSIYSLEADHRRALIRAEEDGYNKGVRDMREHAEKAIRIAPSLDENGYVCTKDAMLKALQQH